MAVKKKAPAKKGGRKRKSRSQGLGALTALLIMVLITIIVVLVTKKTPFDGSLTPLKKERAAERQKKDVGDSAGTKEKAREAKKDAAKDGRDESEKGAKPRDIRVYFLAVDDTTEKIRVVSTKRTVRSGEVLELALRELLKGPGTAEKSKGYISALPPGLKLRSAVIKNGTAVLDFNGALEQGASGSILISRVDQIVYTATQFGEVRGVILKINGSARSTIGSDGLSVSGPLHRRPQ